LNTTEGYIDTEYTYSTTATDPDNDTIQYRFDWGDETTSNWSALVASGTNISLTHNWSSNGTYAVKAQAKDSTGDESIWSDILMVTIQQPISIEEKPVLTVDIPENISANQMVMFTILIGDGLDEETFSYTWDFGDGTTGTGETPTHTYDSPGTYTVTVSIYANNELVDSITTDVRVSAQSGVTGENESEQIMAFPLWIAVVGGSFVMLLIVFLSIIALVFSRSKNKNGNVQKNTKKNDGKCEY
jgi:plastocyanin